MEALSQPMISTDSPECCEELVVRLDILRRNESFCDVKVVVNDEEFAAHRAVLAAASPFFLSLLISDMRESKEHLIRIELEEATVSVMEDVLQYVYTGNVSVTEENAHNLVATADYLLLPGLKTVAGRYLKDNLETGNCIFNYYFADKYQCEELKEEARDMINSNFSAVIETEDFLSLDIKQVTEWVSSDDITVKTEEEVFKGIVKWVSHDKSEREVDFPGLLRQVRLVSISHDFLLNELVKDELVAKNSVLCLNFVLDAIRLMASATTGQVIQKPRKCLETHMDAIFVCGEKRSLCYFPKQNLWYQLSDMAYNHNFTSSPAQCRDKVYIPCSKSWHDHYQGKNLMEFYIPTTNSYSTVQLATTFTCTAVLKGFLYATCDEFSENKGVYRYDPEKNYLNKLKAQPTPRRNSCFVSDEQYLYTIGGRSYGQYISTTERFDPSANEWEEVAPIHQARSAAFGASMNGKVYIAGGVRENKAISSCEVYNPVTNEWHLIASLKEPRRYASMVHYEGSLYVVGGFLQDQHRARRKLSASQALSVEIFHSEQNKWEEKTVIPLDYIETSEEEDKEKSIFKACFARLHKGVIDKLKPLNK